MKVRTKLIIGYLAAMVLLWSIVLYSANNMGSLKEHFLTVESDIIPNTIEIYEIEKAADEAYQLTMDYVLRDLPEAQESSRIQINELEQLSQKYIPEVEQINSDDYSNNQQLLLKIDSLALTLTNVINLKEVGASRSELLAFDRNTSLPALLALEQFISEIKAESIVQLAAIDEDYRQAHFNGIHWLLVSAGLITCIGIIAAFLTTRSIVRPLHALHKGTEMIAQGRLEYKVGTKAKDEIGQLSRAFDQMTMNLEKSMTSIDVLNAEITERKKAEEALRKSEERYRDLFNNASELIQSVDSQGKFIYANKAWQEILGYDESEMEDLTLWDIIHPDFLPHCKDVFQRLMSGEEVSRIEVTFISKYGKPIQVEGDINAQYENNEIVATRGIFHDVTERKKFEETLRTSEEKFRALFEDARDAIFLADAETGILIDVNPAGCELIKLPKEKIVGMHQSELHPKEEMEKNKVLFCQHVENVDTMMEDILVQRSDGTQIPVDISASLIELNGKPTIQGVFRDITPRKEAEKALRESEEKFSKAFRSSPNSISISTIKDGIFIDVNDRFTHDNGYTRDEVIGKSSKELGIWVNPRERDRIIQILKKKGRVVNEEYLARRKSGEIRTMLFSAEPIVISGQDCLIAVTTDITERKQAEEALRASQEFNTSLLENAPTQIVVINPDTSIRYVNPKFEEVNGWTAEEIIGIKAPYPWWPAEMVTDEGIAMFKEAINMDTGQDESIAKKKNGEFYWLDLHWAAVKHDGELQYCLINSADITERKNMAETLRIREERFSDIAENALEWIWEVDAKGKYIYSSPVVEKILGYTPEEVLKKHFYDLFYPEDKQEMKKAAFEAFEQKQPFRDFINRNVHKNGKVVYLSTSGVPILDAEGNLLGYRGVDTDITERKQAEKALEESEDKFSKAFRSSPNTIVITTIKEGRFIEVNDSFTGITGYTREEVIGNTAKDINIWAQTNDRDMMLRILKKNGRVHNHEFNFRIKSGEIRTWLFSAELIDISNEPCMISMTIDITELKRAEEAIKESEEKFFKAFHSSPAGISISLLEDGSFIEINNSYTRITGYSRKELIGHTAEEYNMWAKPEQKETMIRKLRNQEKMKNEEYEFRVKSGKIRTMLVSSEYLTLSGKPCVLVASTDITERKRMVEALRESEDKFNKAFHASPDIAAIVRKKDHKYLEVNENFLKFYGLKRDEVIGRAASEIGIWGNIKERNKLTEMIKKEERVRNEEIHMRAKSGEIRTGLFSAERVSFGGEPCFVAMTVDITRRKQAEEALRMSEERFRLIADNATDLISRIQIIPDIRTDYVSPSCFRITGYKQEEFYNDPNLGLEMIHPDDREFFLKHVNSGIKKDQKPITVRLVRKNGKVIWIEQTHAAISNDQGETVAMHLIARDITERKNAEEQLKQAMVNLEQSSAQLAATNKELEAFSYSVSHDLRSPLRSIDGFSQALIEDYAESLDETGKDYLNRLRTASQKMGELIDGLLKLSRLTRGEMHQEEVDLSMLAEEITSRLQENEPKRQAEFVIRKGLTTQGDPELLRALFENLLGNAWKFTSKSEKARIEFGTTKNGKKMTYFINDNGVGFDMAYADKLFGAFQRLHDVSEFPGTGIGLATVLRIINRHGGNIWAEGAVNKGATFYFTLN